ncbi:phosphopantetheine-binding protein [Actinocorallia sp. A-T 12471]|uniref:phosphopantetheine-binding protein n=1 Tax=Actinocorallia sp. A-T 12471 TaxID=3089813 RepID=UPI0029CCC5FA|nr:phosphopantetheine-binding protein [Actinocorallia sp. A-T 12471]MDX6740072.1 phosphopantetheine-binding protein [Actinocorallia sp. A-T 12471]
MADAPLTLDRIRADVAEVLYVTPADIQDDTHLIDQGMDSIRLMTLVERWRADGARIEFVDLADQPTVTQWFELLNR